jgi:hypothetical protein
MNTVTEQLKQLGIESPKFGRGFVLGTNRTKCPECSSQRKKTEEACLSVTLEEDGAMFLCHHCSYSGRVGAIISTRKTTFTKPDYVVVDSLDSVVSSYFNGRGITNEVLKRNKIGYVQTFMPDEGETGAFTFPYFRGAEVVNVKYRSAAKSFKMERGAELCLYGLNDISGDSVIFVEGECLPGESEVLTGKGWVQLKDYSGDCNIIQFNADRTLSAVKPNFLVRKQFSGNLIRSYSKGFHTLCTPEHSMIAMHPTGRLIKHTALNTPKGYYRVPRVGVLDGPGVPLSNDQIAFCLAVSADAAVREENSNGRNAALSFAKDRKAVRFNRLISKLDITNQSGARNGERYQHKYNYCVKLPNWCPGRFLPAEWLTQLSYLQREFIINELTYWDGNSVPNRNQTEYSSKYYENASWVQTLCHTAGRVSTVIPRQNQFGKWFKVSLLHGKSYNSYQCLKQEPVPFSGVVYCVNVPSGMFLVRQNGCVLVTGNCDKLSVEVAGITSCVSVPNGAPSESAKNLDNHLSYLHGTPQLNGIKKFIIATDNDGPGRSLKNELVRRLGPEKCWTVEWPEGVKDANEALVKLGADSLIDLINSAEPVIPRLKRKKLSDKYLPPPPELAFHTPRGDIVLLQSITNHGKSTLLRNAALRFARGEEFLSFNPDPQNQKKVLICNFEFSDPTSDLKKMLAGKSDYDNIEIIHSPRFGEADLNLSNYEHFKFFKDSCAESQADIIVIDTYASSFAVLNENDNAEATKNIKLLRGLAKDCDAVVVVSHHLGKMKPDNEQTVQAYRGRGASALPGGAAAIFNLDASKDDFRFVTLTCAKNKSGLGEYKIPLELDTETRWFSVLTEGGE